MHFKVIPALLMLAPAVLANPVATDTADLDAYDTDELNNALANIPSSILTVLATAIPQSWYMDLLDPASQSAFLSEASAGVYPDCVIAWASSAAENGDDFLFGSATATDESVSDSTATGSRSSARTASATATATATATQTETDSESSTESSTATNSNTDSTTATSDAKSSETASNTASSAASSTHASETSTGGAPLATGSVAMSLAGAAGLLGLIAVL
ncbi:unnamed protein product [Penicillium pancosmium]